MRRVKDEQAPRWFYWIRVVRNHVPCTGRHTPDNERDISAGVNSMGRVERQLGEGDTRLVEFAADLRRLRAAAGGPAYRELSRRAHYSATTLSDAAGGRRLPSLSVTLAYVTACGGDTVVWERRWRALAAELTDGSDPRDDAAAPYVGLAMFQAEDAGRFFGRERLVAELVDRVTRQRFVMVVGPSGSGKSSLLRAGLVHQARTTGLCGGGPVLVMTPGSHPLEECAAHLAVLTDALPGVVHAALRTDPRCLHRSALQALVAAPPGDEVVVVVDQFEELFTVCRDVEERAAFIAALQSAAAAANSRTRIVVGLRADFYAHCTHSPELVEALREAQVLVGPMSIEELRSVITQPALDAGCRVETALVSRIVADATGRPGVLPLVSHALLETWRRRRGTTLTLAGYDAAGGITQSIARTAETTYTALSRDEQHWARQVFLRLVALGEGTEDTKRRINRAELDLTEPGRTTVLERLAQARLITLDRDTVEVTHEALIQCWPRLHDWLTEDRDSLRIHRQLTEAANTWQALQHDPDALYRGTRLTQTDQWATTGGAATLSAAERDFLLASRAAHARERSITRRRARLLRQLLVLLTVLLVLATVATGYAMRAERTATEQRNIAIAQKVLSQAAALRATNPALAMQLTLATYRLAPLPFTREALLNSFTTPYAARITDLTDNLTALRLSPDGRVLVITAMDGSVRIWDITTRNRPRKLVSRTAPTAITDVAFSPDGRTLAVARADHLVELWDVTDPGRLRGITTFTNRSRARNDLSASLAFSPDGRTLAVSGTADHHGTVTLWNIGERQHPREQATLTGQYGQVYRVVFLPGRNILATANKTTTDITSGSELRLWDVTDPAHPSEQATVTGLDNFIQISFRQDGHAMATSQQDKTVTTWDITDVRQPRKLTTLTGLTGGVLDLAFSPDGHTLATASSDRTVQLWDVGDLRQPQALVTLAGFTASVSFVAFSPDGHTLTTGTPDHVVRLDDISGYAFPAREHGQVHFVSFHPDGRTLATAHADGTVGLWDTADPYHPQRQASFAANTTKAAIRWVAFSPNGDAIAAVGVDGTLALWNVSKLHGAPTPAFTLLPEDAPRSPATSAAFSPDGRVLAAGHQDGTVDLWNLDETPHRKLSTMHGARVPMMTLTFHPNGRFLAGMSSTPNTTLWDVSDLARPETVTTLKAAVSGVFSLAFSPDGRTMATGNYRTVRLWDISDTTSPRMTTTLTTPSTAFTVVFSPNSRTLAVGRADDTTELWDISDPHAPRGPIRLAGPVGGGNGIGSIAFSPNNHVLATAGTTRVAPDRSARLWDTDTDRVTGRLCELTWPAITRAEWNEYFPGISYQPPCP
jgi:WD40 repeat protein